MLALEDDGITASARRRISDRIAELEQEIGNHQASLGKLRVELDATPPDAPTVADVPDRLPVFGDRLQEFSQPRLRRLFDSLDLMITYDPVRHAARVRITLATDAGGLRGSGRCAQLYTILRTPRHRQHPWSTARSSGCRASTGKVRRDGYRNGWTLTTGPSGSCPSQ